MALRCQPISSAAPVRFEVRRRRRWGPRLYVEQRCISLTAIASGLVPGTAVTAHSPIERFGVVTSAPAQVSRPVAVTISSRDSPEILGEVCFSAERMSLATRNARAEAFANAGVAVKGGPGRRGVRALLQACARLRWHRSAPRGAVATCDGGSSRTGAWRAWMTPTCWRDWALAAFGPACGRQLCAVRIAACSQAEALLDSKPYGCRIPCVARARNSLSARGAQRLAVSSRFGAREVPRLDTCAASWISSATAPPRQAATSRRPPAQCERLKDWECYARARQNIASLAEEAQRSPGSAGGLRRGLATCAGGSEWPQLSADISEQPRLVLQAQAGLFSAERGVASRGRFASTCRSGDCDGARIGCRPSRVPRSCKWVASPGRAHLSLAGRFGLECRALLRQRPRTRRYRFVTGSDRRPTSQRRALLQPGPGTLTGGANLSSTPSSPCSMPCSAFATRRDPRTTTGRSPAPPSRRLHPYAFAPRMQLAPRERGGRGPLQHGDARARALGVRKAALRSPIEAQLAAQLMKTRTPLPILGLARAALLGNPQPADARRRRQAARSG